MSIRVLVVSACLAVLFSNIAAAAQPTPSWGGAAKSPLPAKASGQATPFDQSGNRQAPPPPASPQPGPTASGCATPPARPPGLALQTYDPLALGLHFRGIQVSSILTNVIVAGDGSVHLSKDGNTTRIGLVYSHPGECRELPRGAYTAGIDIVIEGQEASGAITIIDGGVNPNDPVIQSCPVVLGAQRCIGSFNTLNRPNAVYRDVAIKFTGQKGILQGRIVKIVVDTP